MASTIKTNTEDIIRTKEAIDRLKEEYKQKYDAVYKLCDAIFEAGNWAGSDAQKYNTQIREFLNDFNDLYRKLNDYSVFLQKASQAYESTQSGTTKQAGSLATDRNG